ncbi:MAG: ACT domain-containing protein [Sedimentisphaerales bacterium]|nr:ACT domain-containing protein [Sedimentisphaerales bacterium]
MKLRQISVFLENRRGRLAEVARVLGNSGINIRALSLADTSDFGILRLIVNDPNAALGVLKDNGYTVRDTEVIAVEVDDQPGGLAQVLAALAKSDINVEYMYAFVEKSQNKAVLVFRFEDLPKAIDALLKGKIRVLTGEEVYSL